MSASFKLCIAQDRHSKKWQEKDLTLADLSSVFGQHVIRKSKDGLCFVAATLLDGKRNLKSVDEVHMLVYDIDGAQSLDEVRKIVSDADVVAYIYTTYSHKSTRTYVLTDHYEKWAKQAKVPQTPSLENLQQYLAAKGKAHLKNLKYDDMRGHERVADMGNCYVLDHDPVDKIRVVFPLAKPIVVSKLGTTNAKCNDAYKAIYHGVGQHFKFDFDPSCSDPTRLFYFPSCPEDKVDIAFFSEYEGKLLDANAIPRATVTTKKAMETGHDGATGVDDKPVRAEQYGVKDRNNMFFDMWKWYQRHIFTFDVEGMIDVCLSDQILAPRAAGGYTITCPFEAEHSDVGGTGTFACNEDGAERGWTIYCSHASCQSEGRKKLDFLKEWVTQGLVTIRDILSEREVEELIHEQLQRERTSALEDLDVDIDVLPKLDADVAPEVAVVDVVPMQAAVLEDPEKFRTDVIDRITHAGWENELFYVLKQVAEKAKDPVVGAFVPTADMLVEWLTTDTATISLRDMRDPLRQFTEEADSIIDRVGKDRAEKHPFISTISGIIQAGYAGLNLAREIRRVANWYGVSIQEVRREYDAQRSSHWKQILDGKLRERFPKLSRQFGKLVHGSKVEIIDEERTISTGKLKTLTVEAFHNLMANETVDISEKDNKGAYISKTVAVSKQWWKTDTSMRVYNDVTFDPGQPSPKTHANEYNLWSGFPLKPVKLTAAQRKEVEDYAVKHIRDVWCEGNIGLTEWCLMFFADIFQRPWNKPPSAICIMGGQGTGKSIILDAGLQPALRTMYTATSERDQLVGKFNKHAEGNLLWLAEESLFSGDVNSMNKLKDLISRDKISIEPKTKDIYEVPNRVRYVFTSNQMHPLNLEQDDRRFLVLGASDIYKQDTDYNGKLKDWCAKGGAQLFMSYLMEWKFCEENKEFFSEWKGDPHGDECTGWRQLFKPPNTRYKDSQKKQSLKAADDFFVEILRDGRITSLPDHILMEQPRTFWWPYEINADTQCVGGPDSHHITDKGTLWLKISKTEIRNIFNAYVRFHDSSGLRWARNQFGDLWDKYFGRTEDAKGTDYVPPKGTANPANPGQWGMTFWPRRNAVNRAWDRQLIDDEAKTIAEFNPNGHINNAMAEKDHQ